MKRESDIAIGFAGLSSYQTDVDGALAEAERVEAGPRPLRNRTTSSTAMMEPMHRDRGAIIRAMKKPGGWFIGIGIIFAIKAALSGGPPASNNYQPATPPVVTTPMPASDSESSTTQPGSVSGAVMPPSTSDWQAGDDGSASTASPVDTSAADPSVMTKPTAHDTATLSISELRYCLAEDIRLQAEQSELDEMRSSDVDRYNNNVESMNVLIKDYQGRCNERSFRVSDRQIADPQIEMQRTDLTKEGRDRVL